MGENWEKGDLALCIDASHTLSNSLVKGRVYHVTDIALARLKATKEKITVLLLAEYPTEWNGFAAFRFRKVTPPKADEFDREVIELMTKQPVEA